MARAGRFNDTRTITSFFHQRCDRSADLPAYSSILFPSMKFTILLADLETLLRTAGLSRPKKKDTLILSACAARVFIEFKGDVAGTESLVLSNGAVGCLPRSSKAYSRLIRERSF